MNKHILYTCGLGLVSLCMASCDHYLDVMPDNRATLDTEDKIKTLLVSAYCTHEYAWANELSSDNCDDNGSTYSIRWQDDTWAWKVESETGNESLKRYWEDCYTSISACNEALNAIEQLGGEDASNTLRELKGEALMSRAYHHFMLANLFCAPWTQNASQNLGLPYMDHPETELAPKYERGNLADFYNKIEEDLLEGLARVGDSYYQVPKYHFNQKAAYAFATRF